MSGTPNLPFHTLMPLISLMMYMQVKIIMDGLLIFELSLKVNFAYFISESSASYPFSIFVFVFLLYVAMFVI